MERERKMDTEKKEPNQTEKSTGQTDEHCGIDFTECCGSMMERMKHSFHGQPTGEGEAETAKTSDCCGSIMDRMWNSAPGRRDGEGGK
jgi:hypothetical protein